MLTGLLFHFVLMMLSAVDYVLCRCFMCSELVILVVILSCFVTSFDILCYVWRFDDHMLMVHGDLMMHECLIIICDIH